MHEKALITTATDVLNSVAESLANGQISNMHQCVSKDIALNAFFHEDEVNMEIKKNGK